MKSALFLSILLCVTAGNAAAQTEAEADSKAALEAESRAVAEGELAAESKAELEANEHEAAILKADELLAASDLPKGTKSVTLAEALRLARKRNLTLKQMELEFEKADARLRMARALLLPVAQAELQYILADHPDEVDMTEGMPEGMELPGDSTIVVNPRNTVKGSITVSQPLVNISSWRNYKLAKSSNQLTGLTVEEVRRVVLFGTAQAYFSALMSQTLVELYKEQIVATRVHLRVAKEKYLAGSGLRIDMLRAGIDFEQAGEDLLNARVSLAAACDALGVLTGQNGMLAPTTAVSLQTPDADATLEKEAAKQRVDLTLKREYAIIAQKQVDAALAELFPSLSLAWQGTYQFTEPPGFGSTDRSRWNVVLSLSIPLFNYYTLSKIRESKVLRRQSELEIEVLEQNIGQEVRQAKREHETALANVRGASRRVRLAEESLQLAEAAYAAGAGTSLDVTDARRMYLQAEVNLAATALKTQLTLLTLLQSIGEKPSRLVD